MARLALVITIALMVATPLAGVAAEDEEWPPGPDIPSSRSSWAELVKVDSVSAVVEVPPQDTRVLRVDHENASLVPVDWFDPVEATTSLHRRAVDLVEPWLQRDLAVQLNRMGGNGNRFAQLIVDCSEADWVDEIAFTVAHTPPEVLTRVGDASVLRDNARHLYEQDGDIRYADLVERTGEDGAFTTVSYLNHTGVRHEYPRDVYYWYVAHARVFWEDPAKVSGRSFWRKAYWDEITYEDSGTLKSHLVGAGNIIEAANASTIWMQMNMEFGYGTNPLQPVQVILERYGSCGQYSITTASSLKVAMIPARVTIYPASDHQWCEVYIDGHWMHLDASNDVAGDARVKEPELIRRTNTVNFNDAGVFERGWKPYMSATSTFRSDDVVINSIDISAPDPSFTFRESGMTERLGAEPHIYTGTSTVTINVRDRDGDPLEGAYVGVFRMGHDIYNPDTPDYPHFAYANYTNATGQTEFELGLQGYCSRCDDDHYYAALILSRYNQGTNDFFAFSVPEENREYSFTYTVTGDAPRQVEPPWSQNGSIGQVPEEHEFLLNVSLEAWGRQRHTHGEWGQYEVFGFRTSFDHVFPSDVDLMVVDGVGLQRYCDGDPVVAWMGATDAERFEGGGSVPHDEDIYLILSNTDSHHTTKVVNVTVDLSAICSPDLVLTEPGRDTDHSTAAPLVFSGNVSDYIPITGLDVSLDAGETWTDLFHGYDAENGTFSAGLNTTDLPSGDYDLVLRATNEAGVEAMVSLTLFLDAEDPQLVIGLPREDMAVQLGGDVIGVYVNASDNRELVTVQARLSGFAWHDLNPSDVPAYTHEVRISNEGQVGPAVVEARAIDGVGRTTVVSRNIYIDAMKPLMELDHPEPDGMMVVGPDDAIEVTGSVWDEHGIWDMSYRVDDSLSTNLPGSIDDNGDFSFLIDAGIFEPGEHLFHIDVRDLAAHLTTKSFTVVMDTSPPTLLVNDLDPIFDDTDEVELTGKVSDPYGLGGSWFSIDGADEEELEYDLTGHFFLTLPSGSGAIGAHNVTLRVEDAVGNERTRILEYEIIDETNPQFAMDTPRMGERIARGNLIHVSGTASDNVAVTAMTLMVGIEEIRYILENLDPVLGQWSIDIGTNERDLGQLVIEVRVEDDAGNMAIQSVIVDIVDRTDPVLELAVDPQKQPSREKGKMLVVPANFSDDVGVTMLEYRVDGWTWMPVPCQFPCEGWDVEVPTDDLATGIHVLEVRATDAAGNDVVVSTPFEVTPVPEESSISTALIAGIVIAVVVVLLMVYFLVLRRRPVVDSSTEEVPDGDIEREPEREAETEPGSDNGPEDTSDVPPQGE